jgi:hypothetical protein
VLILIEIIAYYVKFIMPYSLGVVNRCTLSIVAETSVVSVVVGLDDVFAVLLLNLKDISRSPSGESPPEEETCAANDVVIGG